MNRMSCHPSEPLVAPLGAQVSGGISSSAGELMARKRGEVMCLVAEFKGIGERPHVHDGFGHESDWRTLGDDQDAGTGFPGRQMYAVMFQHGSALLRHPNPLL